MINRKISIAAFLWLLIGSTSTQLLLFFGSGASLIIWIALNNQAPTWFLLIPVLINLALVISVLKNINKLNIIKKGIVCQAIIEDVIPTNIFVRRRQVFKIFYRIHDQFSNTSLISFSKAAKSMPRAESDLIAVCLENDLSKAILPDEIGYGLEVTEAKVVSKEHAYGICIFPVIFTVVNLLGILFYLKVLR